MKASFAFFALFAAQALCAQIEYTIVDLGTLGMPYNAGSHAFNINENGQIVGQSWTMDASLGVARGFCTQPLSPINQATDDLHSNLAVTVGGNARSINNLGQAVGVVWDTSGLVDSYEFRTQPQSPINQATDDLGSYAIAGSTSAGIGINSAGQTHAFLLLPINSNLVWSGSSGIGKWDTSSTANFSGNFTGMFATGDSVTFNDSSRLSLISVDSYGVAPSSVVFANTAKQYVVSGGSIAGSTGIKVSGGGAVELTNANTYSGGTVVESGTLIITSANALPSGQNLTIGRSGTVVFGSSGLSGTVASPVPEPTSFLLLIVCLIVILAVLAEIIYAHR